MAKENKEAVERHEPERVVIEIFGDSFALKTDDPEHMKELARLVDRQMRKNQRTVCSFDSTKLAILAALQFAEEYCQLKRDYDDMMEQMR